MVFCFFFTLKIKKDTAKISDVGTLKPQSQISGTIIGTPVYMAPEAAGGQIYGLPADIFSLAIVMWEMWYGRKMLIDVVIFFHYDFNMLSAFKLLYFCTINTKIKNSRQELSFPKKK